MVLLGAVYAPRAPNGSGALRSRAFRGVPRRRVVAAPAGSLFFGGASRVCCSCWFCCWWSAVGRAACCGAVAVLAARWCVAFGVVLGRFSRPCVVSAALVPWLVSVPALVVGPPVVSVPGCFLGAGSVVAVALGFLVPVVVVGVVAVLFRVAAPVVRAVGRSGLAGVAGCASRAGVRPVSRSFPALFFLRRCPFLAATAAKCGSRRKMRLPPQKRGYRRKMRLQSQSVGAAISRPNPTTPEASPNHPPPSFPHQGERGGAEPPAHRCGGDGGRPTGKFGFRPFPPIITGGQAPIFPTLEDFLNFQRWENRLTALGR